MMGVRVGLIGDGRTGYSQLTVLFYITHDNTCVMYPSLFGKE